MQRQRMPSCQEDGKTVVTVIGCNDASKDKVRAGSLRLEQHPNNGTELRLWCPCSEVKVDVKS